MASVEELNEVCISDQHGGKLFGLIFTRRLCDVEAITAIIFIKIIVEKSAPVWRWQRSLRPIDEGNSKPNETDCYNQNIIMSKNNFSTPVQRHNSSILFLMSL